MGKTIKDVSSNPKIVKAIEDLCGASLAQLIEEGRIMNLKGERFIPEGEQVQPSMRDTEYSEIESEAIGTILKDGVLVFPNANAEKPEPVFVELHDNNLVVSDAINEPSLGTVLAHKFNQNGKFPIIEPDEMQKPGFFNRLLDSILGIFGGSTSEMNQYRKYEAKVKEAAQNSETLVDIEERIWEQANNIKEKAVNNKVEVKNQKMLDVTRLFAPEKLGADVDTMSEQELDVFNHFATTLKGMAAEDYKVRNLLLFLGKPESQTNPAANKLHTVYAAYRTAVFNGKDADLKTMFKDAIYKKPDQLNGNNLSKLIQEESLSAKQNVR